MIEQIIVVEGMVQVVYLLGWQDEVGVCVVMDNVYVLVMFSFVEGLFVVIMEVMVCV